MPKSPKRPTIGQLPGSVNAAIIGGGEGAAAFIRFVTNQNLERVRFNIRGIADIRSDAPGLKMAREQGVDLITKDYRDLFEIPDLNVLIELTGDVALRDRIEKERPRQVHLIDHFAAAFFLEHYATQEMIIRQRTEMRERVEVERNWFSQIFNSLPDEILVLDKHMSILDANTIFLKNNNYTREEIRHTPCHDLAKRNREPCKADKENCPFFKAMETKKPTPMVRKHLGKDGQIHYSAIVASPYFNTKGEIVGVIESTRDITHRIQLEEDLKITAVMLKQFMDFAPFAVYVKDPKGRYLEINQAGADLFNREKNHILGKTDFEILDRDTAHILSASDVTILESKKELRTEEEINLTSRRTHMSTIKYPLINKSGEVEAVCGISVDVTELKKAELELTRTNEHLQNILNNTSVIIITTDLNNRIVSFNPGAEESLGYHKDEVIGKPVFTLLEKPDQWKVLMRRVNRSDSVRDYEASFIHKNTALVPVSVTLSQLKNPEGHMLGTVSISKDISRRKGLMQQVMQSEKLAAVGRLAAGVAHEINNPIAVIGEISGYLNDLISSDPELQDPDTLEEINIGLPKMNKQVKRCRTITHRLLKFARKSEAKVEIADVNAALDEIIPFVEKEARFGKVKIHLKYADSLPNVRIEEMQLQEIFINLLTNAIHVLQKQGGGDIWVTTRYNQEKVTISFKDNGPGIADSVKDHLFDPFVTTKPPGKGTGLGLAICYGIIKRYDGEITVETKKNEGAEFSVILPIHIQSKGG